MRYAYCALRALIVSTSLPRKCRPSAHTLRLDGLAQLETHASPARAQRPVACRCTMRSRCALSLARPAGRLLYVGAR